MANITLLSQIINKLNRKEFKKIADKLGTDKYNKGIDSWTHFVSMLFMQLANSNSLSEISNGLRLSVGNLNHLGITKKVPVKSSLPISTSTETGIYSMNILILYKKKYSRNVFLVGRNLRLNLNEKYTH